MRHEHRKTDRAEDVPATTPAPPVRRTLPSRLRERLRTDGILGSLRYARHLCSEWAEDRRLGISTRRRIPLRELGILDGRCKPYAPVPYRSFEAVMRGVPVSPEDEFLDLGCGMGRILILAARRPFRRVLGVEIAPELAARAENNVRLVRERAARAGRPLLCPAIEIVTADAAGFDIPDGITVLHLFDPFKDEVLDAVLRKIRESHQRRPRPMTILYADPAHLEAALPLNPWIRRERRVPYVYAPRGGSPRYEYGVYAVGGRRSG